MVTTRELAIARSVIYASLFDYPLTLEQLHQRSSSRTRRRPEILAVYDGSELLQDVVEYRTGSSFRRAAAISSPSGGGARRAATRSWREHRLVLRLICALPFTRLVALSGSIAHRNLEPNGDLDLFIVTRGPRVWTVTVALLVLTKLLRRRRTVCANFILADSHLALDQQDLFTREPGDPPAAAHRRARCSTSSARPIRSSRAAIRTAARRAPRAAARRRAAAAASAASSACSRPCSRCRRR